MNISNKTGKAVIVLIAADKKLLGEGRKNGGKIIPNNHKQYISEHPEAIKRFAERHPHYARDRSRNIRNTKEMLKICGMCGTTFKTVYPQKTTCSLNCKKKLTAIRRKARKDTRDLLAEIFNRDGGRCYLCGGICDFTATKIINGKKVTTGTYPTIDHIVPLSAKGGNDKSNLRIAHKSCNARKGSKVWNTKESNTSEKSSRKKPVASG